MKKGFLSECFEGVAVKRLSSVEVNTEVSNQHEFNGAKGLLELLEKNRRATARLMIDFGTPVTKIDSPRGESIVPQYALRPLQLRTKAATLKLPQMA